MANQDPLFAQINQCEYIFLRSIGEYGINQLELIVQEAVVNEAMRGTMPTSSVPPDLAFILASSAPIESLQGCLTFRLYWKLYVAYLVTEECVGSSGKYDDEEYEGNRIRLYSKSHFLQHLARDTGGHFEPLMHYKVNCQNHLVDVAATTAPEIEIVEPAEWTWIK